MARSSDDEKWVVAIRDLDYCDGKPSYCITNGEQVIGNWWYSAPLWKAKREARRMNRGKMRGIKTLEEIRSERREKKRRAAEEARRVETAMRLLERELSDPRFQGGVL